MDVVIVVAGGPTVADYALPDLTQIGYTIGVNDAGLRTKVDCVLSMDRLWSEHRFDQVVTRDLPFYVRRGADKNLPAYSKRFQFGCDHEATELCTTAGVLNGTNSGLCALNMAYQMRPRWLYLFGFDMCRDPKGRAYWYPDYEWRPGGATKPAKYSEWAAQFTRAAQQLKDARCHVFNVTHRSAVDVFKKITFDEFLKSCTA